MTAALAWLGGLGLTAGCGPQAELDLLQPQLAGWQRELHLTSDEAHWAPADKVERILVEFPLPGATTGRPTYILYLLIPPDQSEPLVKADGVRGFFIQTRGDFAGLAAITGGTLNVERRGEGPQAIRELTFSLKCEDGSRLTGRLRARLNAWRLQRFETRDRPADVAALHRSTGA